MSKDKDELAKWKPEMSTKAREHVERRRAEVESLATQATYFEVQRLVIEGDNAGHWMSYDGQGIAKADADQRRVRLRGMYPTTPLRTVPFGTGPNGRPGDVTPEGAIFQAPAEGVAPGSAITAGSVYVTPEQAENAALFGWQWTGQANGGTARQTAVEIWRNEIVPAGVTAGGGC